MHNGQNNDGEKIVETKLQSSERSNSLSRFNLIEDKENLDIELGQQQDDDDDYSSQDTPRGRRASPPRRRDEARAQDPALIGADQQTIRESFNDGNLHTNPTNGAPNSVKSDTDIALQYDLDDVINGALNISIGGQEGQDGRVSTVNQPIGSSRVEDTVNLSQQFLSPHWLQHLQQEQDETPRNVGRRRGPKVGRALKPFTRSPPAPPPQVIPTEMRKSRHYSPEQVKQTMNILMKSSTKRNKGPKGEPVESEPTYVEFQKVQIKSKNEMVIRERNLKQTADYLLQKGELKNLQKLSSGSEAVLSEQGQQQSPQNRPAGTSEKPSPKVQTQEQLKDYKIIPIIHSKPNTNFQNSPTSQQDKPYNDYWKQINTGQSTDYKSNNEALGQTQEHISSNNAANSQKRGLQLEGWRNRHGPTTIVPIIERAGDQDAHEQTNKNLGRRISTPKLNHNMQPSSSRKSGQFAIVNGEAQESKQFSLAPQSSVISPTCKQNIVLQSNLKSTLTNRSFSPSKIMQSRKSLGSGQRSGSNSGYNSASRGSLEEVTFSPAKVDPKLNLPTSPAPPPPKFKNKNKKQSNHLQNSKRQPYQLQQSDQGRTNIHLDMTTEQQEPFKMSIHQITSWRLKYQRENPHTRTLDSCLPKISVLMARNTDEKDNLNHAKGLKYYAPKWMKKRSSTRIAKAAPGTYDAMYNAYAESQATIDYEKKVEKQIEQEIEEEFQHQKQIHKDSGLSEKQILANVMIKHFTETMIRRREMDYMEELPGADGKKTMKKIKQLNERKYSQISFNQRSQQPVTQKSTTKLSNPNNSAIEQAMLRQQEEDDQVQRFLKNEAIVDAIRFSNKQKTYSQLGPDLSFQNANPRSNLETYSPGASSVMFQAQHMQTAQGSSKFADKNSKLPRIRGNYSPLIAMLNHTGVVSKKREEEKVKFCFQNVETVHALDAKSTHYKSKASFGQRNRSLVEQSGRFRGVKSQIQSPISGGFPDPRHSTLNQMYAHRSARRLPNIYANGEGPVGHSSMNSDLKQLALTQQKELLDDQHALALTSSNHFDAAQGVGEGQINSQGNGVRAKIPLGMEFGFISNAPNEAQALNLRDAGQGSSHLRDQRDTKDQATGPISRETRVTACDNNDEKEDIQDFIQINDGMQNQMQPISNGNKGSPIVINDYQGIQTVSPADEPQQLASKLKINAANHEQPKLNIDKILGSASGLPRVSSTSSANNTKTVFQKTKSDIRDQGAEIQDKTQRRLKPQQPVQQANTDNNKGNSQNKNQNQTKPKPGHSPAGKGQVSPRVDASPRKQPPPGTSDAQQDKAKTTLQGNAQKNGQPEAQAQDKQSSARGSQRLIRELMAHSMNSFSNQSQIATTPHDPSDGLNIDGKALMSSTYFKVGVLQAQQQFVHTTQKENNTKGKHNVFKGPQSFKKQIIKVQNRTINGHDKGNKFTNFQDNQKFHDYMALPEKKIEIQEDTITQHRGGESRNNSQRTQTGRRLREPGADGDKANEGFVKEFTITAQSSQVFQSFQKSGSTDLKNKSNSKVNFEQQQMTQRSQARRHVLGPQTSNPQSHQKLYLKQLHSADIGFVPIDKNYPPNRSPINYVALQSKVYTNNQLGWPGSGSAASGFM